MATVILKPTEQCNSNCYYCDVVFKKKHSKPPMTLEMLETVFIRANEYLLGHPHERLEVLWHGGEPLLLGPEYFQQALAFQQRCCPDTWPRLHHTIQTNLTCFSEDFARVLRQLGITSLGTSYDPEPHMRGPGREIDSDTYNRLFMDGLRLAEKLGFGWGLIYVVTKKSLANALPVFFFLTNLNLKGGVNFNPVLIYDEERQDVAVTPAEYVEFLGTLFPYWWAHRERYPEIQPFKGLADNIIDGHTSLGCGDSGLCTYMHINVAPDGETSQCGRADDWGLLQYGNIQDKTFAEILHDKQRDELELRVSRLPAGECQGCRFWDLCHGGCPLDAYSQHRDFLHKSEWCEAKKGFIEKYFTPITGVEYEAKTR